MRLRPRRRRRRDTVFSYWLRTLSLLLILFFALFIAITSAFVHTRADRATLTLLDRALTIAWTEYNRFLQTNSSCLPLIAYQGTIADKVAMLKTLMVQDEAVDFWFVADPSCTVVAASAVGDVSVLEDLCLRLQPSFQAGSIATANEMISLKGLRAFSPDLADAAVVSDTPGEHPDHGALVQLVAAPFGNGEIEGVVALGHLMNNDQSYGQRLAVALPNAYSTISLKGVRIAGNLSSAQVAILGRRQLPQHIETIQRGERYYGHHHLADDVNDLVVSDPIRNSAGEVVGALTIGHPVEGLTRLKEDLALWFYTAALLCWLVVLGVSFVAAKHWAAPVISLSQIAQRISGGDGITPEHIAMLDAIEPGHTVELENLQQSFRDMTMSLYEKNQQIEHYVAELQKERSELQRMAEMLQTANATLEVKVEERTRELKAALSDLAATSNMKSKLLSNTSHELRTPLNSIIGFSDNLINGIYGSLTDEQQKRVRIIGDSARYLLKLINDLLDVSLIHQGKLVLDLQWVQIGELIESVASMFQGQTPGVAIRTEIPAGLPPVLVDPTRIKQVLFNLLTNAVKFSHPGDEVRCSVYQVGDEMVITVADNGVGIPEEALPYVFDEFFQAENDCLKQAGIGLGLPLSKELVELHGGRITLESEAGKGTTVTVYLPIEARTRGQDGVLN